MKNGKELKKKVYWFFENYGPIICGIVAGISVIWIKFSFDIAKSSAEKVLDATITFSSILVGFVGVLLGILFSIRHSETVSLLFESKNKEVLKGYFKRTIISGLLLVFASLFSYVNSCIIDNVLAKKALYAVWGFLLMYTLTSTYRIIHIIMHILFSDNVNQNAKPESLSMGEQERNDLKETFRKK